MTFKNRGFTLVELVLVTAVLGLLVAVVAPLTRSMLDATAKTSELRNREVNASLAQAMLDWSAAQTAAQNGKLPAPVIGPSSVAAAQRRRNMPVALDGTLANPDNTASVLHYLSRAGIPATEHTSERMKDGTTAGRIRVYQRLAGIMQEAPLFPGIVPSATLTYDLGVLYITECLADAACSRQNPPNGNALLNEAWEAAATDTAVVRFSTLPLQMSKLEKTSRQMSRTMEALKAYRQASENKRTSASPAELPHPKPDSLVISAHGGGCWPGEGWFRLNDVWVGDTTLLEKLGLPADYGKTAWGANIEYCADYVEQGYESMQAVGIYRAALRINRAMGAGNDPDAWTPENNILLVF